MITAEDGGTGGLGLLVDGFGDIFAVMIALFVLFVVLIAVQARRRGNALRDAGLDPRLTAEEQIALGLQRQARSPGPVRGIEERLRELDDLLRREVITAEEHAAARARVRAKS